VSWGFEDAFGLIADTFGTQPSELWAMDADGWELMLWLEQAKKARELRNRGQ
jgi:hypothetical protein